MDYNNGMHNYYAARSMLSILSPNKWRYCLVENLLLLISNLFLKGSFYRNNQNNYQRLHRYVFKFSKIVHSESKHFM